MERLVLQSGDSFRADNTGNRQKTSFLQFAARLEHSRPVPEISFRCKNPRQNLLKEMTMGDELAIKTAAERLFKQRGGGPGFGRKQRSSTRPKWRRQHKPRAKKIAKRQVEQGL